MTARIITSRIKHGIVPWRGMPEVFTVADFFFILGEAMSGHCSCRREIAARLPVYFLNKLSKAARASLALRGDGTMPLSPTFAALPEGRASRATVTRGENSSHVFD